MRACDESAPEGPISVAMIGSRGFTVSHSGLETHVRELASAIGARGHHVTVYGRSDTGFLRLTAEQLPESPTAIKDGFCLGGKLTATISNSVWATIDAVRSRRFDLLHFHGVGCVFGIILAGLHGIPTILSLHNTNWQERKWSPTSRKLIHGLEGLAVRRADDVIAVSRALASRVRDEYGAVCHVIPNGVRIKGKPEWDGEALSELGLESGRYILHVGRVVPDKGCHVLLEALRIASIPMKLAIVGPMQDAAYCRRMQACAPDSVVLPGVLHERELGALYRNCWLFCSASVSEGQSIVVLEALAHGARCLVSDIPAHRESVPDPGMRFPVGDAVSLGHKMLDLYARDDCDVPGDWLQHNPQYSYDTTIQGVLAAYRTLLERTRIARNTGVGKGWVSRSVDRYRG